MKIIERKHREAVDKLAAQKLLRAENNARRRLPPPPPRLPPTPRPPHPTPPPAPPQSRPALSPPHPALPRSPQPLTSPHNPRPLTPHPLPPTPYPQPLTPHPSPPPPNPPPPNPPTSTGGWLAGPLASGGGASLPRRGGGRRRGRRGPCAGLAPRPAAPHLQRWHRRAQDRQLRPVLRGQEDMRGMNTQGPARPLLPLRHARGRRRRSGLGGAAVQRVERARCAKGLCCTCPSGEGHRSACSGVGSTIVGSGARARAAWGRGHGTHGRPYARVSCVRPSSVLRARFDFPYKAIIAAVFPQRVPTELEHRLNSQVLSDFWCRSLLPSPRLAKRTL
jgi:hypothetical protein